MLKKTNKKIIDYYAKFILLVLVPLIIYFLTYRPEILGHDYRQYYINFNDYITLNLRPSFEIGFYILSKLSGESFITFLFIVASFSIILKVYFINNRKNGIYAFVFFLIYLLSYFWLYDVIQIRISVAYSFFLFGVTCRNKALKYLFYILSVVTHVSMFPLWMASFVAERYDITKRLFLLQIFPAVVLSFIFKYDIINLVNKGYAYTGIMHESYLYLFHPYSLSMLLSLYIYRTSLDDFVSKCLYLFSFYCYLLFAIFLILDIQVIAMRFIELGCLNLFFCSLQLQDGK